MYNALIWGIPKTANGTIKGNIGRSISNRQKMAVVKTGGKPAVTHYKTVKTFTPGELKSPLASLIECQLETGRTHQIRVHMAFAGTPIVGDPVYGQGTSSRLASGHFKSLPKKTRDMLSGFNRQALHAKELGLIHPVTGKKMKFTCELPQDMKELIKSLQ